MVQQDGPQITVPEAASRLGVSESTIRNWIKAFGDLIASGVGPDGYRRYSLRRLERVAALRSERLTAAAIRASLAGEPVAGEPVLGVAERQVAALERIAVAVERIADRLDRLTDQLDPPAEDG